MVKKDDEKDDWGTPGEQNQAQAQEPTEEEKKRAELQAELDERKAKEDARVKAEAKKKADAKKKAKDKALADRLAAEAKADPKPRNTMPAANSTRSALSIKKAIKSLTERYNKIVFRDDETATLEVKAQLDALTWALNSALSDSPWLRF